MPDNDDMRLLAEYASRNSEEAFAALVRRRVNLVYTVALRRVGDPDKAQDVTQAVFVILAQKAGCLRKETVITGWLYQTTLLCSASYLRGERRRWHREQEAFMQAPKEDSPVEPAWKDLAPTLDDAMARLGEKERNAILLRYFEGRSVAEVAAALGMGESALKARVSRAIEKLRKFFVRRGVVLPAAALVAAITANSVQAAPERLAATAATVAVSRGGTISASTLTLIKGVLKVMAWTKAKAVVVISAGVLLAAGTTTLTVEAIHQHRNDAWQLGELTHALLTKPPYRTVIVPTQSSRRTKAKGVGGMYWDANGRVVAINASVEEIARMAYMPYGPLNPRRTIMTAEFPTNKFDFLSNLPHGAQEALQQEAKRKFGVVGRFETIETNVWLLKVKYQNSPGLKPSVAGPGRSETRTGSISTTQGGMDELANRLESDFGILVLNQTGLTNNYAYDLQWDAKHDRAADSPNLDALQTALSDQLGLELEPAIAPVKMLVLDKASQ
jgi:uncharacterized protein (TIGR03435 family)